MKHTYMYIVKAIHNPLFHYHQSDLTFHRSRSHYQNLSLLLFFQFPLVWQNLDSDSDSDSDEMSDQTDDNETEDYEWP
jgi:hypothetical protein